jgi:hypothetical protein
MHAFVQSVLHDQALPLRDPACNTHTHPHARSRHETCRVHGVRECALSSCGHVSDGNGWWGGVWRAGAVRSGVMSGVIHTTLVLFCFEAGVWEEKGVGKWCTCLRMIVRCLCTRACRGLFYLCDVNAHVSISEFRCCWRRSLPSATDSDGKACYALHVANLFAHVAFDFAVGCVE